MFFKISSLKNFEIFTEKYLCWGLFLIKLQDFKSATFLKRDSNTGASCGYCKFFKNSFFIAHLRRRSSNGGFQGVRAPALFQYSPNCALKFLNPFRRNALKNQFKKRNNPLTRSTNSALLTFFKTTLRKYTKEWFSPVR